jgi:hypothetical protein
MATRRFRKLVIITSIHNFHGIYFMFQNIVSFHLNEPDLVHETESISWISRFRGASTFMKMVLSWTESKSKRGRERAKFHNEFFFPTSSCAESDRKTPYIWMAFFHPNVRCFENWERRLCSRDHSLFDSCVVCVSLGTKMCYLLRN